MHLTTPPLFYMQLPDIYAYTYTYTLQGNHRRNTTQELIVTSQTLLPYYYSRKYWRFGVLNNTGGFKFGGMVRMHVVKFFYGL